MSATQPEFAVPHEQAGTLKLRGNIGHRWWGFVLAMNFFLAPMGALAVSRLIRDPTEPDPEVSKPLMRL